jgi:hypothetical protein
MEKMKLELLANTPPEEPQAEIVDVLDKKAFGADTKEGELVESFDDFFTSLDPKVRVKLEIYLTLIFQYAESMGFREGQCCATINNN